MPPSDTKTPTRRRARKGEGERLRDEILDAAEGLLAEKGHPDAVSMRAIAGRVGVSVPALYLHFDDKDDLFFQCCSRGFAALADVMQERLASASTAFERLEAMGRAFIQFGLDRAEQYGVMFPGATPEPLPEDDPGKVVLQMAEATVAEGVASGELRAGLDPVATATALWAVTHGTVVVLLARRNEPSVDEEAVVDQMIEMVRSGLVA